MRYDPLLVTLHWLLAIMVIAALVMGDFMLSETPNSDPEKLFALRIHMITGISILVLMIVRLVVRYRTKLPPEADIGNASLNKLGSMMHYALYLVVIAMAASGIGISILSGLPDIVFFGSGAPLPENFDAFTPRLVHGIIAKILALLILGHVAAALYYQFVRRDGLFSRMWFGQR